jgi:hypothetical protein
LLLYFVKTAKLQQRLGEKYPVGSNWIVAPPEPNSGYLSYLNAPTLEEEATASTSSLPRVAILPSFVSFAAQADKSDNLTVKDCFAKQLLQIRGCSPPKVYAIVQQYPTPMALMDAYDALGDDLKAKANMLADIVCGTGGKRMRIGPKLSEKIMNAYNALSS